ncbi:hypothetical protein [Flavicella sediminum]|uniref:hypothetical protein n=1 Tax=Flavicella sediminum TaxID=2585141 RepID=UPI00112368BA|nr:hypothetical protein [Flavicella sediminum]
MMNQMSLIEDFRTKVLSLIEKYPEHEDEINDSCTVCYVNGRPSFSVSHELDNKYIENDINSIFNDVFK